MEKTENTGFSEDTISNPLVSIIVITYNSSKYVLETLESAKAQTYQNIELIISDDCSQDNTVEICKTWLEENEGRFVRLELITVPENTGIPANCNRGVKASKGEWVKFIAGDDALTTYGIEQFVKQVNNQKFVHTNMFVYDDHFDENNYRCEVSPENLDFFCLKSEQQLNVLEIANFLHAPTFFYNTKELQLIGAFDEEFKLLEDYPMYLKILNSNNVIEYLPIYTAKYRIRKGSISTPMNKLEKPYDDKKKYEINREIRDKYCSTLRIGRKLIVIYLILDKIGLNNRSYFSKILYFIIDKCISGIRYRLINYYKRKNQIYKCK